MKASLLVFATMLRISFSFHWNQIHTCIFIFPQNTYFGFRNFQSELLMNIISYAARFIWNNWLIQLISSQFKSTLFTQGFFNRWTFRFYIHRFFYFIARNPQKSTELASNRKRRIRCPNLACHQLSYTDRAGAGVCPKDIVHSINISW